MKVAVFSAKEYDRRFLEAANRGRLELEFFDERLDDKSAESGARFPAVCAFVNDPLDANVLQRLADGETRMIALRCAGFNNVDLFAARRLGFVVARVPAYSPRSISEFAIGLILALSRKICKGFLRTREGNFSLEGLLGTNVCGKTVVVVGTGRIGSLVAESLVGFGCRTLAVDPVPNPKLRELGVEYVDRDRAFREADFITLHCPLTADAYHSINEETIATMKRGVAIVNTSRGGLVDVRAVLDALKTGQIGAVALDVYEEEGDVFFEDYSDRVIQDDLFARMLNFPNVIVTGHQAFFTVEAMTELGEQTIDNILAFRDGKTPPGALNWGELGVDEKKTAPNEEPIGAV